MVSCNCADRATASRIILFGESAGAASTDYYTWVPSILPAEGYSVVNQQLMLFHRYIWTEDPIIAGTISESGQANSFGNKDPVAQAQAWYTLSTAVGCGNTTTHTAGEVVACMKDSTKVTADELISKSIGSGPLSVILASFGPTVDNKTVFSNYTQLDIEGRFVKKPALVGNNDNEAGIFILIFGFFGITQPQAAWDALTQQIFTCPSNTAAYARRLHHVPIWRYRYFPSFPNINLPTSVNRAYHLSEVFPLFGTDVDVSKEKSTHVERRLGRYMRDAWAAFAHSPSHGLRRQPFNWPEYSADVNGTDGLVLLGRNNSTRAEFGARGEYDGSCPLIYQGLSLIGGFLGKDFVVWDNMVRHLDLEVAARGAQIPRTTICMSAHRQAFAHTRPISRNVRLNTLHKCTQFYKERVDVGIGRYDPDQLGAYLLTFTDGLRD
nr:hypothetical protein CFP56_13495 [Quercus suber]